MKRIFILLAVMLMAAGLFAEEAVLIDFTKLGADIIPAPQQEEGQKQEMTQHKATVMDFGVVAGATFTPEQKRVMKTSLAIRNWTVRLNSSARSISREVLSYADEATSKQFGTVMGIRVNFPTEPWNSNAFIRPPFDIPAYDFSGVSDEGEVTPPANNIDLTGLSRFEGTANEETGKPEYAYGVVKNVGTIKSVSIRVFGLQFPHSLSVILIDSDGNEKIYMVDYLNFDGWAELVWNNPAYVQEVRNRELRLTPLYPTASPFVKFGGFLIKRDADKIGGDFVAYFRDVRIIYDKAVLGDEPDINSENLWHIISDRERARTKWEVSRFGQDQILQYLSRQKKATESFTPSPNVDR